MRRREVRLTVIERDLLRALAHRGPESIGKLFQGHPQAPDGHRALRQQIRLQSKLEHLGVIAPSCQGTMPDEINRHRITDLGMKIVEKNRITMRIGGS